MTVTVNAKKLGKRIARYRQEAGIYSGQLAEMLGIYPSSMSKIEQGYGLPPIEDFQKICDILNVSPDILLQANDKSSLVFAIEEYYRLIGHAAFNQLMGNIQGLAE